MRSLLIINPVAGQSRPAELLRAVTAVLRPMIADVVVTDHRGHAEAAAREAAGAPGRYESVVVAGGDGTINEVINGLMAQMPDGNAALPLGLLPIGTQNVLGHELRLPTGLLECAGLLLESTRVRRVDLGRAGSRYFALMAGFGFDAAVVREVARPMKDLIGTAAYAFATVGALAKYNSTEFDILLDDEKIHATAFLVVVANTASYALHGVKLAPFAAIDDGWLDVCVFERAPTDRMGFANQLMAVLARRHLRDPRVRYYRARSVTLTSHPPVEAQLDGDTHGLTPIDITIAPRVLSVLAP